MSDRKPAIKVSSLDFERLEALLNSLPANSFPEAELLAAELDRAEMLDPKQMPADVVTMNSSVRFVVEPSGKQYELTLVYPKAIDGAPGKISILAPVGSALLGLSVGQEIEWAAPGGNLIRVRIIDILYQPERAGDFHL